MQAIRRAKILCTLGPATNTPERIGALIDAGMNAARLNFSHGEHQHHEKIYQVIRNEARTRKLAIAILADLQGPKIRVGQLPDSGIELHVGDSLTLTSKLDCNGSNNQITIDYPDLSQEAKIGDRILLDDGQLELVIEAIRDQNIVTKVIIGGRLLSRKGVNLPGTQLKIPALTKKDEKDLRFALELGVDMVALSFVRTPDDLKLCHQIMDQVGRRVPLIAKIEKPEAVANMDAIIDYADGVMVARGDLGVEMGPEEVPSIQKQLIERANGRAKLVITATQMLDSMIRNPRPTRAEASDVANAVLDGSDAVMLSGETASGDFPVESVATMARIIRRTEMGERYWRDPPEDMQLDHMANTIAQAAVGSSRSLSDTCAIVTYTGSGGTARLISEYRPKVPIYAFTPEPSTYYSLALHWGVIPVTFAPSTEDGEHILADLDQAMLNEGLLKRGDRVVVALGWPIKARTSVNLLKIHRVGDNLPSPI